MAFSPEQLSRREESVNKTIYIRRSLIDRIEKIAAAQSTSFNHVVISMIESCLKDLDER